MDKDAKEAETYTCPDGKSVRGTQSNEAPVRYLLRRHPGISEIICLKTEKSAWDYFKAAFETPSCRVTPVSYNMENEELTEKPLAEILSRLNPNDRIYLETTGGTRDTVMFFLLLTRILSYNEIEFAGATYSDYWNGKTVKDVSNLYAMFNLVNGMQELSSFGSVGALRQYYGRPAKDGRIEDLLKSAESLTEAITLCRTEQIDERLEKFNEAVAEAEQCGNLLLRQLLPAFRKKFWDGKGMTIPGLIKWCLNSDMLQQALTIYKEKMPGYLLSQKSLMEWKRAGVLNEEEEAERKKRHQSPEEALFHKYFLSLERNYPPVTTLQRFDKVYESGFLAVHAPLEQIRFVAADYFYIRALRNMVNHASDRADGDSQEELENYLKDCLNSQRRRYKRLSDVTAEDVRRVMRDALENLKPRRKKGGK